MGRLIALRKGRRHPNHGNSLLPTSLQLERIFREQSESPQSFHVKVRICTCVLTLFIHCIMFIMLQFQKC